MARQKRTRKESRPGRLRIVAGKWRSRLLPVVDHASLRPTSERIRETLFNWLSDDIAGSRCLDLYAGTGALGFEALSRGAAGVTFVEATPQVAAALQRSAATLQTTDAEIVTADAIEWLRQPAGRPFDIVFLDPPFAAGLLEQSCHLLHSGDWLAGAAFVYVETARSASLPEWPPGWSVSREKTAGNVRYLLLRTTRQSDQPSEEVS